MNSGTIKTGKIVICAIGVLFGIYCVIAGFAQNFFGFDFDDYFPYLDSSTYGADWTTEIAQNVADIGTIAGDVGEICSYGFRAVLIIAGVLMILCFLLKLLHVLETPEAAAPTAPRPYSPAMDATPINGDFSGGSILGEPQSASSARANAVNGSWTCWKCGANNPEYLTTCSCGLTKHESDEKAGAEEQLRVLKERHDKGLISDEEYEARRGELAAKL